MTSWSADELGELNRAGSLRLTAGSQPGWETELGMVTVDGQLYVRAYRGPSSRWFQAAQDAGTGKITAGTLAHAVRMIPDPGPVGTIDDTRRTRGVPASSRVPSLPACLVRASESGPKEVPEGPEVNVCDVAP